MTGGRVGGMLDILGGLPASPPPVLGGCCTSLSPRALGCKMGPQWS